MMDWPQGYGRRILDSVDSTNAEAARIAPDLAGPEWVLALRQTAGRGRRGRPWADPAGNFAATLVMRPNETPDQVALRSFVAALALFDACVAATGREDLFSLKWPNDVLLKGGKLAGILLESAGGVQGVSYIAIGIGVNLSSVPDAGELEQRSVPPVSIFSETGVRVTPTDFLDLLAPAYARHEATFQTYGFAPIRKLWLSHAAKLGEVITARTMRHETTGTFETGDEAGNIVLSTANGRETVPAAEIFF
jgi:BirA family biotin operon repressor/biotin-[acetyl-CoA-carboxylase] ligase